MFCLIEITIMCIRGSIAGSSGAVPFSPDLYSLGKLRISKLCDLAYQIQARAGRFFLSLGYI